MCFFSSPHSLIQESKGHGAPHRQHFILLSIRAYEARYEDVMTNCHLGHMFYETCTPFNHVYCPAQTLRFSPIVHRVQDYIGSAVVERRVQAASNVSKNEMSTACRQNSDLYGVPGPRFALDYVGTSVLSEAGVRQRVRNKPLNQI